MSLILKKMSARTAFNFFSSVHDIGIIAQAIMVDKTDRHTDMNPAMLMLPNVIASSQV